MNFIIHLLLPIAGTGFILRAWYLNLTMYMPKKSFEYKLRQYVKKASIVLNLVVLGVIVISFDDAPSVFVLRSIILLGFVALFFLIVSVLVAVCEPRCRFNVSKHAVSNRYLAFIIFITGYALRLIGLAVVAVVGAFIYLIRNGSGGMSSSKGTRNPYGNHGYLTNEETTNRAMGRDY